MKKSDLKDIYPLSPLQEGLLFHHLYDKESTAYFEQVAYRMTGDIDLKAFEESWNYLLMRHDILRTLFIYEQTARPLQVVVKERKIEFHYNDIRSLSEDEQHRHLNDFKQRDRKRSFDLSKDVLMRINIFQTNENDFYVVWSHHHILIDGWSLGILSREFVKVYESLKNGQQPNLPLPTPYAHFIKWLEKRDDQKTEHFWKQYLSGYEQQVVIPKYHHPNETKTDRRGADYRFELDEDRTLSLNKLAVENRVTINTVIQCLWAILLSKYNHVEDIVFGVTASVRPEAIRGINDMVGLFINTIPTRIGTDHKLTFSELLQQVQQEAIALTDHHYYPLNKIQNHAPFRELFDHILVFENYPLDKQLRDSNNVFTDFKLNNVEFSEEIHYDLGLIVVPGDRIVFRFTYNPDIYESLQFKQIEGHLPAIIESVLTDKDILLRDIKILSELERTHLITGFNDTRTDYPRHKTIVELFEEQVSKTPDRTAVGFKEQRLSYRALNERANQLAHYLTNQYAIHPDDFIGLMLDRSEQMVIAILAILKSGGAYVPIDPEYPIERIDYMVKDIACKVIITEKKHANIVSSSDSIIFIEDIAKLTNDSSNLTSYLTPNNLAYVIYTSGSTGQPKGVMVEHRSVVRLVKNTNYIAITEEDRILQTGPLSFDASTFEIWGSLLNGATVYMTGDRELLEVKAFGRIIKDYGISIMWLTSSLFNQMVERDQSIFTGLKNILVGGERLSPPHINKLRLAHPQLQIINGYGPTENTTFTCCYKINRNFNTDIPIGRPISNTRVYVLDNHYEPVPIGVPGYLYISGDGLARGYLNGEELTKTKFLPCPFEPEERMYNSGDMVRWLPDGNIEFLGRQDEQVKIRGYRIECGEIEHTLLKHQDINEAVVIAKDIEGSYKELVAYIVSDKTLNISELRGFLIQFIPDYMVPSKFVPIESIPLTANKKVDKRALPDPDEMGMETGTDYCPASNEVEKHLVKIWEEVIGRNRIGINDNYFDIGGDSIKAIQIMARLQKVNLKCDISDFFKFPHIKDLAPRVVALEKWIPQQLVTGTVLLTPIQHWFFKEVNGPKHHFNHSILFHAEQRLDDGVLSAVFQEMIRHHDALRMTYKTAGETVIQENQADINFSLQTVILQNESEPVQKLTAYANQVHREFNLENGPLIRVILFRLDDSDRLLIIIHHLVVDGVSWRILFEDISTAYEQAQAGKPINLPSKTHSYQAWAKLINEYSRTDELLKELDYWKNIEQQIVNQPLPYEQSPEVIGGGTNTLTITLTENETDDLLTRTNHAYKTQINDILLTALAIAFNKWHGETKTIINLESHGRENLGDLDISRTIGWFTSIYPVILDISNIEGIDSQIKTIKETLRKVPKNGIGYHILKYLTPDSALNSSGPSISFNYLGQFDQDLPSNLLKIAEESTGEAVSPQLALPGDLLLSGIITHHRFSVSLTFKLDKFRSDTIKGLLDSYTQELRLIIGHCKNKAQGEITPSDLSYSDFSLTEFDSLIKSVHIQNSEIHDIYPLSPMQEGLLFHYLYDAETTAFFQQMNYRIEGQLDIHLVEEAWNYLFKRHEILRTIFVYQNIERPIQIVLKERQIDFQYQDIRLLDKAEGTERLLAKLMAADRNRPFNLSKDVLMRIAIIQSGESEYYLLWTFHHILLDGWCLGILYSEFLEVYQALKRGSSPQLPLTRPYSDYLKWLASQNRENSGQYWRDYLSSYQKITKIPAYLPAHQIKTEGEAKVNSYLFELPEEITGALQKKAAKHNVTLNTVLQSLWAILLSCYNDTDDVVFGVAVAGRPEEIEGIEQMVGLFMNTIPVRINANGELTFSQLLQAVQKNALSSKEHAYYPLSEIQANSPLKQGLFDHILVYENYPIDNILKASEKCPEFKVSAPDLYREINYDLGILINPSKTIEFHLLYNPSVYDLVQIKQIEGFITTIARTIINEEAVKLRNISLLSEPEGQRLLESGSYSNNPGWQIFEEQVKVAFSLEQDVKVSVLNRDMNFVPECVVGDIYIGTETKTGFKGRWLWDGTLEITQEPNELAIIAGESITLKALESVLLSHNAIRDCELIKRRDESGQSFILALIEIKDRVTESQIMEHLSQDISETILENVSLIILPAIPLDEEGKVNITGLLNKIPAIEPGFTHRLEADILQKMPELNKAAVITQNREIKSPHLHIDDLLTSHKVRIDELLPEEEDDFIEAKKEQHQPVETTSVMALSDGGDVVIDSQEPETMVDALYRAARDFSDKGTIYVNEEGIEEYQSYSDLLKEASCILNGLLEHGLKPGDKIILQLENLREHLTSFWACILGGIRPVTVATSPTYEQKTSVVNKLYNAWELLEHPFILASSHLVDPINGLNHKFSSTGLTAISISGYPPIECDYRATPEQIAFYQLTSGSTGIPKCIQERHKGIYYHVYGAQKYNDYTSDDVYLTWPPSDHVGALITLYIKAVYLGVLQLAVNTDLILNNPLKWLDLLEKYRVTFTWSPNFGYKLVAEHLKKTDRKWDLSSVKFFMNAAEQVTLPVVKEFLSLTKDFGVPELAMQPAYGMAETCTAMQYKNDFSVETGFHWFEKSSLKGMLKKTSNRGKDTVSFVKLGRPMPGVKIRIVDEKNQLVPEGKIGSLHIKGEVITPGYFNNPEANKEAFVGDDWFNTGDLGFILNGELSITGRQKEVIIIRATNFYCYEIEDIVNRVDGVEPTFAGSSAIDDPASGSEGLAIFFSPKPDVDLIQLNKAIRTQIATECGVNPSYVIPIDKEVFPKTTSGKIQRTQMRHALEQGEYNDIIKEIDIALKNDRTLPDWFFKTGWRKKALRAKRLENQPNCLVLCDDAGLFEGFKHGIRVKTGQSFSKEETYLYTLNPDNPEDYLHLLASVKADGIELDTIVHALSYDKHQEIQTLTELKNTQYRGVFSLFFLSKAISKHAPKLARFFVVSSQSQSTQAGEFISYEKGTLRGIVKTISQELSNLVCRHIDLEANNTEKDSAHLLSELEYDSQDIEVAYRDSNRYISCLNKVDFAKAERNPIPFKEGGFYVITGGLGAIGTEIANLLLTHYNARLILIGRTELSKNPDKVNALNRLKKAGRGEVQYHAIDTCDLAGLRTIIKNAEKAWGETLSGIIHLAGEANMDYHQDSLDAHHLVNEQLAVYEKLFHAKVYGTFVLMELLKEYQDALLISFSSVNSFFGGSGFGAYSSANSFLDAVTHYYHNYKQQQAYCFNWSMWDGMGMSRGNVMKDAVLAKGFHSLSLQQGLKSFLVGMELGTDQLIIGLDPDNRLIKSYMEEVPLPEQSLTIYYTLKEDTGKDEELILSEINEVARTYLLKKK